METSDGESVEGYLSGQIYHQKCISDSCSDVSPGTQCYPGRLNFLTFARSLLITSGRGPPPPPSAHSPTYLNQSGGWRRKRRELACASLVSNSTGPEGHPHTTHRSSCQDCLGSTHPPPVKKEKKKIVMKNVTWALTECTRRKCTAWAESYSGSTYPPPVKKKKTNDEVCDLCSHCMHNKREMYSLGWKHSHYGYKVK